MTEQEKQSRKVSWYKYNREDTGSPLELMAFDTGFTSGSEYRLAGIKALLLELKTGILEAIYNEDGLDGADGTYLLSGINLALGLPVDDHTFQALRNLPEEGPALPAPYTG